MAQIIKPDFKKNTVEVADILRAHIREYHEKYPLGSDQYKIAYDLLNCRTAHLGGHKEKCDHCNHERILYNSCRNRHCPKCQSLARERWLLNRKTELLPVMYFHTVFTLPHELNAIILGNKKIMLDLLFKAVSETLLSFGQSKMSATLGFSAILHTWDQLLKPHFHLHCLVPAGGLAQDTKSFVFCKNDYLFNEEAMAQVLRGKFMDGFSKAHEKHILNLISINELLRKPEKFKELKNTLYAKKWVVYVKEPIKNPEYVLEYLGRYTYRVAISNHRILSLNDDRVTFQYKNRTIHKTEQTTIDAIEFIRRFLLHVLPKGFARIRHFGFLAQRNKTKCLKLIRSFLEQPEPVPLTEKSVKEVITRLTGVDIALCPCCKAGKMYRLAEIPKGSGLSPAEIIRRQSFRDTA